ncbi:MAG: FtsK/SpoIIIE domain-containing protein, partial [Acidimicrobiia bacterium]|nr:FtsK/SpoIIIE domain-containing protein [Acidimicrobiia bacterium]
MSPSPSELFAVEVTVNFGASDHDLHLELPGDATGGDLYRLLGSPESGLGLNRTPPLLIIERTGAALPHDQPLTETSLMSGDRLVSIVEPGSRRELTAEFLTGPCQGERFTVPITGDRPTDLGRVTAVGFDDPSVSRRHARVAVSPSALTVEDLGSTNGTVVNGEALSPGRPVEVHPGDIVELGSISSRLVSLPTDVRRLTDSPFTYRHGTLDFQQAPRAADPQPPSVVELPTPPAAPAKRRFPLASAVLPLVMGGLMAYFFSPFFAVFMLMSPLMLAWTFVDDRRSGRKTFQADREAFVRQLAAVRLQAADTADQLAAWHRRRTPTVDQILRWVRVGAKELWARRPRHDDFLTVGVGTARQPSPLTVRRDVGGAPDLAQRVDEVEAELTAEVIGPVAVDLGRSAIVGVTGDGSGVAPALARALVAQLVGLRSYRDLHLAVLAPDRADDWAWCKWLPHTRFEFGSGGDNGRLIAGNDNGRLIAGNDNGRLIAGNDDEARVIFDRLMAIATERAEQASDRIGAAPQIHPQYLVVVHPPVGLSPAALARFLELAPRVGMSVLYLAPDRHDLPSDVSVYIEVSDRGVAVHFLADGRRVAPVDPWTLTAADALTLARDLAPIVDVTVSRAGAGIPTTVTLHEANGLTGPAGVDGPGRSPGDAMAQTMTARWAADPRGLRATIGVGEAGPVTVDLQADGPHALVAGTTGAGKSEFLQTLIADLASNHSPADLNFILIDYKGGSAFRQCERLPHTVGFVTDLDEHLAERALTSLRAELRHRERMLAEAGVSDLKALQAKYRHSVNADLVMPSLVIVIDEFAALKSEVPAFVDGLIDVAQRGRSMGVHMILATQKPGGVITPQIDANTNIRVALRVANESDSRELIGVVDAATIATDRPGRALLKIGGGSQPIEFQSAYVGGRSVGPTKVEPGLAPFEYRAGRSRIRTAALDRPPAVSTASDPENTDLRALVDTACRVWGAEPRRPLRRPWLPPLPEQIALPDIVDAAWPAGGQGRGPNGSPLTPGGLRVALGVADHPAR